MKDYDRLERAAIALAATRIDDARADLAVWEAAVAATGRAASVRVGNEWALDRLRARLER